MTNKKVRAPRCCQTYNLSQCKYVIIFNLHHSPLVCVQRAEWRVVGGGVSGCVLFCCCQFVWNILHSSNSILWRRKVFPPFGANLCTSITHLRFIVSFTISIFHNLYDPFRFPLMFHGAFYFIFPFRSFGHFRDRENSELQWWQASLVVSPMRNFICGRPSS